MIWTPFAYGRPWTGYEAEEDGSFTITLKEGRNIVQLQNGDSTRYYVLKAQGVEVTVTNSSRPSQPFATGDIARIKVKGMER